MHIRGSFFSSFFLREYEAGRSLLSKRMNLKSGSDEAAKCKQGEIEHIGNFGVPVAFSTMLGSIYKKSGKVAHE